MTGKALLMAAWGAVALTIILMFRKATVKSKEDSIPLPDPFPLPLHYSAEVKAGLKAKKSVLQRGSHLPTKLHPLCSAINVIPPKTTMTMSLVQSYKSVLL